MQIIATVELLSHTDTHAVVLYCGRRYFVKRRSLFIAADDTHYDILIEHLNQENMVTEPYDDYSELASIV